LNPYAQWALVPETSASAIPPLRPEVPFSNVNAGRCGGIRTHDRIRMKDQHHQTVLRSVVLGVLSWHNEIAQRRTDMAKQCAGVRVDGKLCLNSVSADQKFCYAHSGSPRGSASPEKESGFEGCTIRMRDGHLWCETHFTDEAWNVAAVLGADVPCDLLPRGGHSHPGWIAAVCDTDKTPRWFIDKVLDWVVSPDASDMSLSNAILADVCQHYGFPRAFEIAQTHFEYSVTEGSLTHYRDETVRFLESVLSSKHCPRETYLHFLLAVTQNADYTDIEDVLLDLLYYFPENLLEDIRDGKDVLELETHIRDAAATCLAELATRVE